jgi:ribokinase
VAGVIVVGPIVRDVAMLVDALPDAGGSAVARQAVVAAGGKGGNPASAAARIGVHVELVGCVGADAAGRDVVEELGARGIGVSLVAHAAGAATGHIVHLVEPGGRRRYVEDPGANTRLEIDGAQLAAACAPDMYMLLSTAIPRGAAVVAAQAAHDAGASLVIDASGEPDTARAVLPLADVLRCDGAEARALTGREPAGDQAAAAIARELLAGAGGGPRVVIVGAPGSDVVVAAGCEPLVLPHAPVQRVDPTGGGDAFVGTLTALLARGEALAPAARMASAAAADTVARLGGAPRFDVGALRAMAGPLTAGG